MYVEILELALFLGSTLIYLNFDPPPKFHAFLKEKKYQHYQKSKSLKSSIKRGNL